jgi:DNA-binding NtrC family response regulator
MKSGAGVSELDLRVDALCLELARAGGPLEGLVGKSAAMQEVFGSLLRVAKLPDSVLFWGEPGSGKTAAARALHALSPRRPLPLILLDAESGPDAEEGAVSEALSRAEGGTLLVREITSLPERAQVRLEEEMDQENSVRLLATSSANLREAARDGKLLAGLARALGRQTCVLSPLRSRREDIPLLCEYFLRSAGERGAARLRIDPRATEAMLAHEWPGNIRELRNVIIRSRALTDGPVIGLASVQSVLGGASARRDTPEAGREKEILVVRVGDSMAEVERRLLHRTLEFAKGNKRKAAEILKLSLKTIYNKVKEYGLEREYNRRFRKASRLP